MNKERLLKQIEFIVEIDKLKRILRQNVVIGTQKQEDDAEHSWHLAVMAIILSEHAAEKELDILKVVKMVLIHDLVEIDAGDTFCYDEKANQDKAQRDQRAAQRLFTFTTGPGSKIWELWQEFEGMGRLKLGLQRVWIGYNL